MRRVVLTALVVGACGGDGRAEPAVVEVAAQSCASPNRSIGLGVAVADGVVATAAHTVEGDLRMLTVDGEVATVLAVDERTDLALLATSTSGHEVAELSADEPAEAIMRTPAGDVDVDIVSTGPLVVHDTTAGRRHEREVHRFTPGVARGTSGAPLVDVGGRVLGIVLLDRRDDAGSYAATAGELANLLAMVRPADVPHVGNCPS